MWFTLESQVILPRLLFKIVSCASLSRAQTQLYLLLCQLPLEVICQQCAVQDPVNLPEGSAPGISAPPVTKAQACCAPCSTRIELPSYSRHHRVYHRPSTPVKQTAWRSWAHWPIWKVEADSENHWEETLSSLVFLSKDPIYHLGILMWRYWRSFGD